MSTPEPATQGDDLRVTQALDALVTSAALLAGFGYHQGAQDCRELLTAVVTAAEQCSVAQAPVMTSDDVHAVVREIRKQGL